MRAVGDDASNDDSSMKTCRGMQKYTSTIACRRRSCRYDTGEHSQALERDAAIIIQGPASVWFGRLEVAYRRALDAFPCRPAVLSSPSIASIGYSSVAAAQQQ